MIWIVRFSAQNAQIIFSHHSECLPECLQVNAEARRNQLMRDMAQLRLKAEVTRLEGSLQSATADNVRPTLPPYVVPDGPTLCEHFATVRQLAASSRFIVIIPLAGRLPPLFAILPTFNSFVHACLTV